MRERAALGVLAGEPDRDALDEQADANASASAWPQSMPPSSSAAARRSSWLRQLRVDGEVARATERARRSSSRRRSAATAVTIVTPTSADCAEGRPFRRPGAAACRTSPQALVGRLAASARRRRLELRPRRLRRSTPSSASCSRDTARARSGALRSAAPSAAACTPARPARCGRNAGSRRGRRRRRGRTGSGTRARAGSPRSPPRGRRR